MDDYLYENISSILLIISCLGLINIKQYGNKLGAFYALLFILTLPISWFIGEYLNPLLSDIIVIVCYSVLSFIALKFKFKWN